MAITNARSRGWCFTINNYADLKGIPDLIFNDFEEDVHCLYAIFGYEEAPSTGTPHIQGYVYYQSLKSGKQILNILRASETKAHIEPAKGTTAHNRAYCTKSGKFKEHGEPMDREQGHRGDLDAVHHLVKDTGSIRKVIDAQASFAQIKYALAILPYVEQIRAWKPKVVWFHGPTGSGKTKAAFAAFPDPTTRYRNNGNLKWWDGYDGQANVIIDDIRTESIRFVELLSLLDRYEYRVENKGGYRQFLAKNIIITCPTPPATMYWGKDENVAQLLRRIDNIIQFPDEIALYSEDWSDGSSHTEIVPSSSSDGSSPDSVSSCGYSQPDEFVNP